jgi:poly(3-hydroxyalkanoate) synthetase
VREGLLLRSGSGRSNDPYQYWLKGIEEKWAAAARARDEAEWHPLRQLFGDQWVEEERQRRAAGEHGQQDLLKALLAAPGAQVPGTDQKKDRRG